MYPSTGVVRALVLSAATACAFQNTSPFFLASTSSIINSSHAQLQSASTLLNNLTSGLSTCPSDYYVIVSQPGVHSTDFADTKSSPQLGTKMLRIDKEIQSSLIVNEVVGVLGAAQIGDMIEQTCGAERMIIDAQTRSFPSSFGATPRIIMVDFPMLPASSDRGQQLSDHDGFLADILDRMPASSKYTLLYITSPREENDPRSVDDVDGMYQDLVHMELKRDYSVYLRDGPGDNSKRKSLFQEYQYLSPGLFMGLLASFVFLSILYVGCSALVSLKVSYAAFERDSSSSVHKKQQ